MPVFNRKCPACAGGFGGAQGLPTAHPRTNALVMIMECEFCAHLWAAKEVPKQIRNPDAPRALTIPARLH